MDKRTTSGGVGARGVRDVDGPAGVRGETVSDTIAAILEHEPIGPTCLRKRRRASGDVDAVEKIRSAVCATSAKRVSKSRRRLGRVSPGGVGGCRAFQ